MQLIKTSLPNVFIIMPKMIADERGYFMESYHSRKFQQLGITTHFVQDNQSLSHQGTVRGLHYQIAPYAQTKLVRVLVGEIWDVVVDLRRDAPTFGHWEGVILSSTNQKQLFVPKGFAHGFIVLSKEAIVQYKCDTFYYPKAERGIHFQDPRLVIPWENMTKPTFVSEKDQKLPYLDAANLNF